MADNTKRFCDSCIANKVVNGLVSPTSEYYGPNYQEDFKYNERCDLCGEIVHAVTAYPPMEKFIGVAEFNQKRKADD